MSMSNRRKHRHCLNFNHRRRDRITRLIVDMAIHYVGYLGLQYAWDFLRCKSVPEPVIRRVLLQPSRRRRY